MISNNITLIGNLGSDIKINNFASAGERQEKTDWFNLTVWNKTCERMAAQVGKGDRVLIEGKLTTNSYENKEGQTVKTVDIVVSSFQKIERVGKETTAPAQSLEEAPIF